MLEHKDSEIDLGLYHVQALRRDIKEYKAALQQANMALAAAEQV